MDPTTIALISTTALGAVGTLLAIFRKNVKSFCWNCISFKDNTPPNSKGNGEITVTTTPIQTPNHMVDVNDLWNKLDYFCRKPNELKITTI